MQTAFLYSAISLINYSLDAIPDAQLTVSQHWRQMGRLFTAFKTTADTTNLFTCTTLPWSSTYKLWTSCDCTATHCQTSAVCHWCTPTGPCTGLCSISRE